MYPLKFDNAGHPVPTMQKDQEGIAKLDNLKRQI